MLGIGSARMEVNAWSPDDAKMHGLTGWSLKPMQSQQDVFTNQALANGLRAAFVSIGAYEAYAPNVATASAHIVDTNELTTSIELGVEMSISRNKELPADGVFLQRGKTFVMSGAGCPLIIATAGEHTIVVHAGRDSLVERNAVLGKPSRKHISIVYAIIDGLLGKGALLNEIAMLMMFSIPVGMFEHRPDDPKYGAYNKALDGLVGKLWPDGIVRRDGSMFVDLESIFLAQVRESGIRRVWTTHSLEEYPDLAHTRDGKDSSRRNLYVVRRNA